MTIIGLEYFRIVLPPAGSEGLLDNPPNLYGDSPYIPDVLQELLGSFLGVHNK